MTKKKHLVSIGILVLGLLALVQVVVGSNIDPHAKYAWSTNVGWINFNPQCSGCAGVTVYPDHLEGYAWGETAGWIRLGTHTGGGSHTYSNSTSDNYGVNMDAAGVLSGYAWGVNVGWINFAPTNGGVTVDTTTGAFDGYAWGETAGWMHFKHTRVPTYSVVAHLAPAADGDAYEDDDACTDAGIIPSDGTVQVHTFHDQADADWVTFSATAGITYVIEARVPPTSTADVLLELYADCGSVPPPGQDPPFAADVRFIFQPPADGDYVMQLLNHSATTYGPDVAYHLSVRALAEEHTPGAVVIVAGQLVVGDALQDNIHNVSDAVYRLFRANGYPAERIYYLATDTNLDADGDGVKDVNARLTAERLEYALTDWATTQGLGPERPFTLYMVDHGNHDMFYLDDPRGEWVMPDTLDGWLDILEAAAPDVKVNVIIEACHSGSFINQALRISKNGRVVIASTGSWALAYPSADGAVFSDAFLQALGQGMSLYGAFEEGKWAAQGAHLDQSAWLDDDGDGRPNEAQQDGLLAGQRGFVHGGLAGGVAEQWPPYIVWATGPTDIENRNGLIAAEVQDDRDVFQVWAVIYPPSYQPPDPDDVAGMPIEDLPTVTLLDSDNDNVYRALYPGFDEIGTYRIVIHAVDKEGFASRTKEVQVQNGWAVYLPLVLKRE